jgi:hypothetical protein
MAYNKGFNPDRLPAHAEPEQVRSLLFAQDALLCVSFEELALTNI